MREYIYIHEIHIYIYKNSIENITVTLILSCVDLNKNETIIDSNRNEIFLIFNFLKLKRKINFPYKR